MMSGDPFQTNFLQVKEFIYDIKFPVKRWYSLRVPQSELIWMAACFLEIISGGR
jgi:hypothetical protein